MIAQILNMVKIRDGPSAFWPEVLSHGDFGDLCFAAQVAVYRPDSGHDGDACDRRLPTTDHAESIARWLGAG